MPHRQFLGNNPDIKIIMLSIHSSKNNIIDSYEAGAVDFIDKNLSSVYEILNIIRNSVSGDSPSNKDKPGADR